MPRRQRFHNKNPVSDTEANPRVSNTVSTCGANNEASPVPKIQKLPACPEGEIVAIALPGLLELSGQHPVVSDSELFLIGNVPAGR